ncbi:MAG: hypothetical protein KDE53_03970 [Caldilineaceae bacterium]|nr:hypothetical protein [Caldilineaceae bacterium]
MSNVEAMRNLYPAGSTKARFFVLSSAKLLQTSAKGLANLRNIVCSVISVNKQFADLTDMKPWTIVAAVQDVVVLNKLRASVVQIYSLDGAFFVGRYDVLSGLVCTFGLFRLWFPGSQKA